MSPQQMCHTKPHPKLTQAECQLLYDNEGCLKCCCSSINYCSSNCPNSFLSKENHKPLTQTEVDCAKCNSSSSEPTDIMHPITAVVAHPIAYIISNKSSVIEDKALLFELDNSAVSAHPYIEF